MIRLAVIAIALAASLGVAVAGFSLLQVVNGTVPAGGYLVDVTAPDYLLNDNNGKLLAR